MNEISVSTMYYRSTIRNNYATLECVIFFVPSTRCATVAAHTHH